MSSRIRYYLINLRLDMAYQSDAEYACLNGHLAILEILLARNRYESYGKDGYGKQLILVETQHPLVIELLIFTLRMTKETLLFLSRVDTTIYL